VKEGSKYSHTYANKVFGGWDMCIEDEAAGNLQTMRLVNEIEVLLLSLSLKATLYKLTVKVSWNFFLFGSNTNHLNPE